MTKLGKRLIKSAKEGREMQRFTQKDYNALTDALDKALLVFQDMGKSDDEAEKALDDFVRNHYFKVWRAMAPRT